MSKLSNYFREDLEIDIDSIINLKDDFAENNKLSDSEINKNEIINELKLLKNLKEIINQKVIVVNTKCDDEDISVFADSETYKLGFKDNISLSGLNGFNMHQLWEFLQNRITREMEEAYRMKIKERKKRIKHFRNQYKISVENFIEEMKNGKKEIFMHNDPHEQHFNKKKIDSEYFLELFDKHNYKMEEESDLDNDTIPLHNILRVPKFIEEKGITFDNIKFNDPIQLAIIGRPNVGKSTIVNQMLGRDISVIDEECHTTKDCSNNSFVFNNKRVEIIDTAGLNKQLKESPNEESRMAYYKTKRRINQAQVHLIIVDAMWAFREQDYGLIKDSIKESRAVIIFINKWDLVDHSWHGKAKKFICKDLDKNVDIKGLPIIFGSALKKYY